MESEERCFCICGSALWLFCINFYSEDFSIKLNLSISFEFIIYFSWRVKIISWKADQAISEGFFSEKLAPVTIPHDFRAISQIQEFLQWSSAAVLLPELARSSLPLSSRAHKGTRAAMGRERSTWKEDAIRRGRFF